MYWRTCLLWVALVLSGNACRAAAERSDAGTSLQLTLPHTCYAVVGVPMSVYYDNIVLTEHPGDYRFHFQGDMGTQEARRWTVTPAAAQVGDHRLAVSVADQQGRLLQRGQMVLRVVPAEAGAGRATSLLIVGDSLTHATAYPNEIARLLSLPGNPSWTMLGTHRPPNAAQGVAHEGYGGWTWAWFASHYEPHPEPAKKKRSSPFVFLEAGKPTLDVPQYFATTSAGHPPEFVTFLLGINDCFHVKADDRAAVEGRIDAMLAQADVLLAAFRKAAPRAELGICLTTPPNDRESGFEANYHGQYHRWGWKRIQHRLVQRQIEHFGDQESAGIFIIPTELNLDPVDGYPVNNGVHPNTLGYQQIGVSIYAWLKARLQTAPR
jgi:lysophospholipase L1-like esterase